MLLTNQGNDKLAAAHVDFVDQEMLPPTYLPLPKLPTCSEFLSTDAYFKEDNDGGLVEDDPIIVSGNVALVKKCSKDLHSLFAHQESSLILLSSQTTMNTRLSCSRAGSPPPANSYAAIPL